MIFLALVFAESCGNEYKIGEIEVNGNKRTRAYVIKRELLFSKNQPYDSLKIEESERILRQLPYLRDVKITPIIDTMSKIVDITVEVKEIWTLYPVPIPPSGGGGFLFWGAMLTDMNFIGMGQSIGIFYFYFKQELTIGMVGTEFYEPRLFGTRWALSINPILNINKPVGELMRGISINLNKPLYAREAKWGIDTYYGYNFNKAFWYDSAGKPTEEYNEEYKYAGFSLTRSFGLISKKNIGVGGSASLTDYPKSPESLKDSLIPRHKYGGYASLSLNKFDYIKREFIDELGKTEDIGAGYDFSLKLSPHAKLLGSDRNEVTPSVGLAYTNEINKLLFKDKISFSTDITFDSLLNTVLTNEFVCFYKLPAQTLAFHLLLRYIKNYEPPSPYRLGGSNGLRGYPAKKFGGNHQVLMNIEDRLILVNNSKIIFGPLVFCDIGGFLEHKIVKSIGTGIRLTFPGFMCPVLRVDFAYPLDGEGQENWSFGINQSFTINPSMFNIQME